MSVFFVSHNNNLGGSSKGLAHLGFDSVVVVHGLGLPGASSHWNGTEAVVLHGDGVRSVPGDASCGLLGSENKDSFGVELSSFSGSDPIPPSLISKGSIIVL
jgi:hypothetical protein